MEIREEEEEDIDGDEEEILRIMAEAGPFE